MKRVVHMSSAHPANDVRIFVKQCCSLASAGYDVTLIARADANCVTNGIKILAVRQSGSGRLGRMVITTFNVLQKALRCRADLYHFHDPELMLAGALLRLTGAKVVYDVHEDAPKQMLSKSWIPVLLRRPIAFALKALEWLMTRFVYTSVVAATPSIALRFPPGKTCSVQNFPIIDELTPPGPTLAMAERPLRVAYAGGLTAIRGVCEMVAAMEQVETPDSRLILAGLFAERDLEQKARALAGWRRVDYLGLLDRPGVANLLGGARAGLVLLHNVPNYTSAYPIKLFEYMSAALPVIASHFPLLVSIVERNRCGLLVDPGDVAAIAKAIDWVLTHPEAAEAMGRRGREAVATTYNWPAEEKKLLEIYRTELD